MGRIQAPRRGSLQFSPRSRAARPYPRVYTWPISNEVKLLGFAGYKAGMTHTFVLNTQKDTPTTNQEVFTPVTVLECPPLSVFAVRVYEKTSYGLQLNAEFWADKTSKFLPRATDIPKNPPKAPENISGTHITVLVHTKPFDIDFKKTPEIFEVGVGGGKFEDTLAYAKGILGKELKVFDLFKDGELVDVTAVTKGKGTQGPIKRFHVKLQKRKHSRSLIERHVGSIGDRASTVRFSVPMAGQMGYQTRTDFNKLIVKIGKAGEQITPSGGFLNYGEIKNDFVLIKGSVPGSVKRLIRFKFAIRPPAHYKPQKPNVTYVSVASKQGK